MRFATISLLLCGVHSLSILHITDFHLDKAYNSHGGDPKKMCHLTGSVGKNRTLGDFGDYNCDSPKALVKHLLRMAKEELNKPDYIIWTGDTFPHIHNYTSEDVENLLYQVTGYIKTTFPDVRVFPVFGNHDYWPTDQLPDVENSLYKIMLKHWHPWIGEKGTDTFRNAGYYSAEIDKDVTLLGLNTVLYYNQNHHNMTDKEDPAKQFEFMERELETARGEGKRVVIIAHIPPGAFEQSINFTWFTSEYNERFLHILRTHHDVISSLFFGHNHRDSFRIIKSNDGKTPLLPLFIAPAVAPASFNIVGSTANNPSFRVIECDNQWSVTDIRQYYVDLERLNADSSTTAYLEYSFRKTYNVTSKYIDANALASVIERLKTNELLFKKYAVYNSVSSSIAPVTGQWKRSHLCALEHVDYSSYRSCLRDQNVTQPPTTTEKPAGSSHHLAYSSSIYLIATAIPLII